jgi:hypothetical protein
VVFILRKYLDTRYNIVHMVDHSSESPIGAQGHQEQIINPDADRIDRKRREAKSLLLKHAPDLVLLQEQARRLVASSEGIYNVINSFEKNNDFIMAECIRAAIKEKQEVYRKKTLKQIRAQLNGEVIEEESELKKKILPFEPYKHNEVSLEKGKDIATAKLILQDLRTSPWMHHALDKDSEHFNNAHKVVEEQLTTLVTLLDQKKVTLHEIGTTNEELGAILDALE